MVIEGRVTESDYLAAQFLHVRPRMAFAVLGVLLLAAFLFALFISRDTRGLITLGALVACPLWTIWSAKRTFRQYKALSEAQTIEIQDAGLHFQRQNGAGLLPWSQIIKWRYNDKLLLLYPTSRMFHLVPAHFFRSQETYKAFVAIISERCGKAT